MKNIRTLVAFLSAPICFLFFLFLLNYFLGETQNLSSDNFHDPFFMAIIVAYAVLVYFVMILTLPFFFFLLRIKAFNKYSVSLSFGALSTLSISVITLLNEGLIVDYYSHLRTIYPVTLSGFFTGLTYWIVAGFGAKGSQNL